MKSFKVISLVFDSYVLENVNKGWNTGQGNPGMFFAVEQDHIQRKLRKSVIPKAEKSNIANRTLCSFSQLCSTLAHQFILGCC